MIPDDVTQNKIVNITKELNKWDKVIKTIKELTEGEVEDTQINFLSNGSLQFFSENTPQVAVCITVILERVVKLYKNIQEIKVTRDKLKALGISGGEQKAIEKQEKEKFNKDIDKITADIIKEFALKNIEEGRSNELKVALKDHIIHIVKSLDKGIIIEVTPPEIDDSTFEEGVEEANSNSNKDHKTSLNKVMKQIEIVQKSMDLVKSIGKTGLDLVKYISSSQDESIDEE